MIFELSVVNKDLGHYNHPPPNFREVTETEFAQCRVAGGFPLYVEARQIDPKRLPEGMARYYLDVMLFWNNDSTGWAFHREYYTRKVRYFLFGCDHDQKGEFTPEEKAKLPSGRCLHSYKCSKCGLIETVDSSD